MFTFLRRLDLMLAAAVLLFVSVAASAEMRITEYMYSGTDGEFVEFTNVGSAAVDMAGWSFDDSNATPGAFSLSGYGSVAPGESVILTDADAAGFRAAWNLCDGVKVIGGNTVGLGRGDQINLYDAAQALIDRLTYGDEDFPGTIRTNGASGWVSAAGLGNDIIADWTLSSVGDAENSRASTGNDIGSPGMSTRASVVYDPCGSPNAPSVHVDPAATSPFLDLDESGSGSASGVNGDVTDPAATQGIGFVFALPGGGDPSTLTISATSGNAGIVDASGLVLTGSGATRQLLIVPHGVGYATITVSATDPSNNTGTYQIHYAASAAAPLPAASIFHTGASDSSATSAIDDQYMFVADDEDRVLHLYRRDQSGLPVANFDFSSSLNLVDPNNPEMDVEGTTRSGDRVFWTGSYSNSMNFHVRPNRHRVFATDLSGSGINATLAYAGRYDWLQEDMVAWDAANGHGLGANYLGLAASSAEGTDSKTPAGYNIEGLTMAPDGTTAYFGFRAPQLPTTDRHLALVIPVLNFDSLLTAAAPDSQPAGSAAFGQPIFLDLGGRGLRSIERNAAGQYLIVAGPAGDDDGSPGSSFKLYVWSGQPADAPVDSGADIEALRFNDGNFESIAEVPATLGPGTDIELVFDNGNSVWYGDGVAAKDLAEPRFKKSVSLHVTLDIALGDSIFANGFD